MSLVGDRRKKLLLWEEVKMRSLLFIFKHNKKTP